MYSVPMSMPSTAEMAVAGFEKNRSAHRRVERRGVEARRRPGGDIVEIKKRKEVEAPKGTARTTGAICRTSSGRRGELEVPQKKKED
jgi:hypothetical protein